MPNVHPLTEYRARRGMTKADLARQLGVSKASITRWESSDRQPSAGILTKIAKLTGVSARKLRPDLAEALP